MYRSNYTRSFVFERRLKSLAASASLRCPFVTTRGPVFSSHPFVQDTTLQRSKVVVQWSRLTCVRAVRVTNRQMKTLTAKKRGTSEKSADDVIGPSSGYTLLKTSGPGCPHPPSLRQEEKKTLSCSLEGVDTITTCQLFLDSACDHRRYRLFAVAVILVVAWFIIFVPVHLLLSRLINHAKALFAHYRNTANISVCELSD